MVESAVAQYGGLDYAFNNVGFVGSTAGVADTSEADWHHAVATNLTSVWLCMKYEIPEMLKRQGCAIVNRMRPHMSPGTSCRLTADGLHASAHRVYRWVYAEAQPRNRVIVMFESEVEKWASRLPSHRRLAPNQRMEPTRGYSVARGLFETLDGQTQFEGIDPGRCAISGNFLRTFLSKVARGRLRCAASSTNSVS